MQKELLLKPCMTVMNTIITIVKPCMALLNTKITIVKTEYGTYEYKNHYC